MKKLLILISVMALSASAYATDITYPNKSTGDTLSAAEVNEIKTAVNSKQDALGADDNYVTDAEKVVIGNTSGTNTGDDSGTDDQDATEVSVDASGFDGNLTTSDDTVQEVAQALDDLTGAGGGLDNVVEDTTPQLGGNLDGQSYDIETTGDIVAGGMELSSSASPTVTLEDSDLLGSDEEAAKIYANATTTTDGAEVTDLTVSYMDAGTPTDALIVDGSDNQVEFQVDTTLQAGDVVLAELATDSVNYEKTLGSFKSLTPVTDDCDDFAAAFTGANLRGGTFVANLAGTCQLPAVTAGMNFCISTLGAIALVIEPNASDNMILDGVQLDDADSATNLSTAGDLICFQYYSAAGWLASSNGWTDED